MIVLSCRSMSNDRHLSSTTSENKSNDHFIQTGCKIQMSIRRIHALSTLYSVWYYIQRSIDLCMEPRTVNLPYVIRDVALNAPEFHSII